MDLTLFGVTGLAGAGLYLGAYAALQLGFLRGSSVLYTVLNLLAALMVLISLGEAFNLSSAIIQVAWITLSVIGLARRAIQRAQTRFTAAETAFLAAHFPALPPMQARKLIRLGRWEDVAAGTALTRQGAPVGALIYLAEGAAEVVAHGRTVARLGAGDLIGEITVIHNGAATADVTMTGAGRVYRLPRAALMKEMAGDHDFALLVGQALQIEAQRKIDAANRRGLEAAAPPPAA